MGIIILIKYLFLFYKNMSKKDCYLVSVLMALVYGIVYFWIAIYKRNFNPYAWDEDLLTLFCVFGCVFTIICFLLLAAGITNKSSNCKEKEKE